MELKSKIPDGPIEQKWDTHRFEMKLVNPANKRKFTVIVVGTGLAGGAAAATLGELGYNVKCFCFQDSPRRAHCIAAQGGINAAKNYRNDGDSVYRLFYDTVKGGDFRAREANVYRLAQISVEHHRPVRGAGRAVRARVRRAPGQPLVRRRAGLAHLLRARADRPAAPARRVPGAGEGDRARRGDDVPAHRDARPRRGRRPRARHRGARHGHRRRSRATPATPSCSAPAATATSSTCRPTPRARTPRPSGAPTSAGAAFANPCYTQIHPTCIPVSGEYQSKLTLMSESLRNDGRVWVPKRAGDDRAARPDPRGRARLLPRAQVPELRQPRAARHRLAGRQGGLRRGPRRRAGRPRRLPRLRRRHQAARRRHHPRALRQPVRDVRADHRRESVRAADADLPGGPLHDGRALGRLQPDEHDPGPVRDRRSQLLRPRRQPARRERAHAGPGRRLLHPAVHDRRLPGRRAGWHRSTRRTPSSGGWRREVAERTRQLPRDQGQADRGLVPPRARPAHVGPVRHGAERGRAAGGAGADPRAPRGVLAQRQRARAATRS